MLAWPVLVVVAATVFFTLFVRIKDIPAPEPVSPTKHLEERKAAIYENLRDLQFEYRVGKLSDEDYQNTKKDLQRELASVLAEVDALKARLGGQAVPPVHTVNGLVCASCGAKFEKQLKFCGECGRPMKVVQA